jgi:hypothetical protein
MRTKPADVPYCGVRKEVIASAKPKLDQENLAILHRWITERYSIHLRKDVRGLPKPWTSDPILQKYRFCNVRREQDRESRWLIEHIALNTKLSYEDKLLNCILFRFFNKHETMEICGAVEFGRIPYNDISRRLADYKRKHPDYVYFSSAFYMSGPKGAANRKFKTGGQGDDLKVKIIRLVDSYNRDGIVEHIKGCKTQQEVFDVLTSYDGIGRFLGYQIFVDFTYIPEFRFSENEFTVAGPGCSKGLRLIFSDLDGMTDEEALFWLRDNQERVFAKFGYDPKALFSDLLMEERHLNVMSLENCMCELSKYIRALRQEGRPRIRYSGT